MKEARYLYKCRLCGKVDESLCSGPNVAMSNLVSAMRGHKQDWSRGMPVYMTGTHFCNRKPLGDVGEQVGISDLIGYKIVSTA